MEKRTILLPYTPEEFRHLVEDSVEKVLKKTFSEKPKKRYVKIDQLATQFGWPKKTIYGWVHQEQIPYLKPGKELMFDLDDIYQWLDSKKVKTIQQFLDEK